MTEEQKKIIDEVWNEMKVGARLLYYEIRRRVTKSLIIKYIHILRKQEEQFQILRNKREGKDAGMKGNFHAV